MVMPNFLLLLEPIQVCCNHILLLLGDLRFHFECDVHKTNEVKNPSGFLVKAIKYRWKAPENISKEAGTITQQENEFPEGFEEWSLEAIDNGFILNESPFILPRNTKGDLLVKVNRSSASGLPYSKMSWMEAKNVMELS